MNETEAIAEPTLHRTARSHLEWTLSRTPPSHLGDLIHAVDGGFFHSPLGLEVGAPNGSPIYAILRSSTEEVGIAVGILHGCRFASEPRHAYFPTLPAIPAAPWRARALNTLIFTLYQHGIAEVSFDSFDAPWLPEGLLTDRKLRLEHIVHLDGGADGILDRFSAGHRRNCRRGLKAGWELRPLYGDEAREAIDLVLKSAARRADGLGRGFRPGFFAGLREEDTEISNRVARLHALSVTDGERLLGAALVGRAGEKAYYIMGGSTPEGYRAYAGAWMHFGIMNWLAGQGCRSYNLGGTPAAAARPDDPGHGLFRFKTQFGGETRRCRGIYRTLRPVHMSIHRMIGLTRRLVQR